MLGSKNVGRVLVFGLGYLAGTRAGRERYAQIEAGTKILIEKLRARYTENASGPSSTDRRDAYSDIKLGD